ncbi:P-loop containing nucleoside triphosphate hydrolase protein [Hypoxylon sp. NC0597]|nr:P-loop containing nucleoside triphosphate hydrolase protein [Hypoxylon sp. NC0597]
MKVLILGMPRTGTQSLADALERLGISPVYHMREVGKNHHQALWIEALDAKFEGQGESFNREKFDQILGSYEAIADYPAAIFPPELMAAYPEASIILSLRHSEDAWLASMESTLWHAHVHQPVPNPSPMAPLSDKYHKHCWGNDLPRNGRAAYRAHNELVGELARANGRKFLEYRPGDGWEPLCEFLGVEGDEVPREPFPRSDDWAGYKRMVEAGREKRRVDATADDATS